MTENFSATGREHFVSTEWCCYFIKTPPELSNFMNVFMRPLYDVAVALLPAPAYHTASVAR